MNQEGNIIDDTIINEISRRTGIGQTSVRAVVRLLEDGATVPFISRYRKEQTGSLDEVGVRDVETNLKTVKELMARKEYVKKSISDAGGLTQDIERRLSEATSMIDVEDIYAPFKPRKRTRATIAREKGLEPLAKIIMAGNTADCELSAARFSGKNGVESAADAIAGASDIIAEWASESPRLRNITRNTYRRRAMIECEAAKGKESELGDSPYAGYGDFSQSVGRMSSHQYLALRRAEREGLIKVRFNLSGGADPLDESLCRAFVPRHSSGDCARVIGRAVADASKRLIRPSVENEISAELKTAADLVAIDIFSANLRQLLLAPPLRGQSVLAIDPGYRTGCKTVALDSQGNLLDDTVIYPVPPRNDFTGAKNTLARMKEKFKLQAVAIGNGTASRETERFVKGCGLFLPENVYVVSENGASVYSASEIARKEFPDKDVTVKGAVSIGRRLIDPLAELVKIDPKSIGVGQYQHDVDQNRLKDALDYTVMSCVNSVGVDVNTASEKLLSYISGIGPSLAANIVAYRAEHGDFTSRKGLKKVARLGEKAFEQSAGFLRVPNSEEPLDNTGIHPESYGLVRDIAKRLGVKASDLAANDTLLDKINPEALASEGIGGADTIRDIVEELRKPGRDPRTEGDNDAFVPEVESFGQLQEGMVLPGLVNNITAFGAFVNLGIKENGLIHISRMSGKRINSVSDVLRLGDKVEVRIIGIDAARKRISLELIKRQG